MRIPGQARNILLACVMTIAANHAASAEAAYPTKPVTIIVPFAPGSGTDTCARLIGEFLKAELGQSFVVENQTGAGGTIAAGNAARAKPDGYTIVITTNTTHSAGPSLFKNIKYDPIKDFAPVARIGNIGSIIVSNPALPPKTIQEFVAYAKANTGKLSYGFGNSTGRVVGETLRRSTGIDVIPVPYRSNITAGTDLISGRLAMMVVDFTTGIPQINAGKMRTLAIPTKERSVDFPDVPTLHETVMPGFDLIAWLGMFAPAGTPPEVVEKLSSAMKVVLAKPDVRKKFHNVGIEAFWTDSKEFRTFVNSELTKWSGLIKAAGIEAQ
jgi:tripartite-type tricarboxylate transporter receptor subunit TctC